LISHQAVPLTFYNKIALMLITRNPFVAINPRAISDLPRHQCMIAMSCGLQQHVFKKGDCVQTYWDSSERKRIL